jgi:hypothetical protein
MDSASSTSSDGKLSEADEAVVLEWLRLKGETDKDKIQFTLDKCATNPATLAWILSGGKSPATNGGSKDLAKPESERKATKFNRFPSLET